MRYPASGLFGGGMSEWIGTLNAIAAVIGYSVMVTGGIGLMAFLAYWPINYAWRRCGDTRALIEVMREAKRQGRSIYGVKRDD